MRELVIETSSKDGKSRRFSAALISYVTADGMWDGGAASTDNVRPVWWMLAGSDNELRPFVANLQLGRKAEALTNSYSRSAERFEFLKSSGFQITWQRTPLGSGVTIFAPDLFRLDPGMVDPKGVSFCILPPAKWLQNVSVEDSARAWVSRLDFQVPEDRVEVLLRLAPLFVAYLDRRTRCPLVPDPRFYVQILCAALNVGLASFSRDHHLSPRYSDRGFGERAFLGFQEYNTSASGLVPGIAFKSSHEDLEGFLAEQVTLYFDRLKETV